MSASKYAKKSFPSIGGHRVELISISIAFSWTALFV